MNTTWRSRSALALAAAVLSTVAWTTAAQAAPTPDPRGNPTPVVTATADAALVENLTFMREEERLARDLYLALAAQHDNAAPFVQIARSEQRHFDSIGLLLTRYGIADPAAGKSAGDYAFDELDTLYADLLAQGKVSLAKAYEVGVAVETEDIADLKAAIAETTQADATRVFTNLMNGSENHLAAFTAAKDGKVIGAGNGAGMQNGRRGDGTGYGNGRGMGRGPNATERPADCPLR